MKKFVSSVIVLILIFACLAIGGAYLNAKTEKRARSLCDKVILGDSLNVLEPLMLETQPDAINSVSLDEKVGKKFHNFNDFSSSAITFPSGRLTAIFKSGGIIYYTCNIEFVDGKFVNKSMSNTR